MGNWNHWVAMVGIIFHLLIDFFEKSKLYKTVLFAPGHKLKGLALANPPKSPLENPSLKPSHPRHLPRPAALVGLAPAGTEDATGATAAAKAGRAAMAGRGPKGPGGYS